MGTEAGANAIIDEIADAVKSRKPKGNSEGTKTLLIFRQKPGEASERLQVKVPANAKVTFGKAQPTSGGFQDTSDIGYCVRIYRTQNEQLAVFTHVLEFRDTSLEVERLTYLDPDAAPEWVRDDGSDLSYENAQKTLKVLNPRSA